MQSVVAPPYGVRGFKSSCSVSNITPLRSHSARVRGFKFSTSFFVLIIFRRTPHGVRGFKLSVSHTLQVRGYVALRMECVDSSEGGMGHVYNGEEGTHIPYGMCGFKYKKSRFSKQTKTQLE